ncbi:hypothetical protein [Streptomyces sp. NPDC002215]|uniref:hypothetical protein n=1 Tax=Streptomyces sp. NPDC002215 TaxID=3154412 RepID=UPI00333283F5
MQRIKGKPFCHGPRGMITARDLLVIKRQHTAADGDLAAVLSNGLVALTRARKNYADHRFMEANPDPIRADDSVLLGVFVGVTTDC